MSKPIILDKRGSKWAVFLDVDAARERVRLHRHILERLDVYPAGALVPIAKKAGGGFTLSVDGRPATFTKQVAEGYAHQIGRYLLDLGDFVYTYTEERKIPMARDPGKRHRRHAAVRIPKAKRAAVSKKIKKLVREGYSSRYAAQKAYHGRDCVGIHTHGDLSEMRDSRKLTAAQRKRLASRQFALPERRALPIENASHVRNAAGRLEQMRRRGTVTMSEYRSARARIRSAAKRFGVHLSA